MFSKKIDLTDFHHYVDIGVDSSANMIKGDVGLILTDEFFMKLLDVDKLYAANLNHGVKGFINTLVRRLKRVSSAAQK